MTIELKLLVWSTALALIQMLIAVVAAMAQVGLMPFVGNRENLPAFEGWAGRAQRSALQYVGKPNYLRGTRASGAGCRQVQRYDGARCPIVLLEPPRLFAGLCHRYSVASHWRVGRFQRRVVESSRKFCRHRSTLGSPLRVFHTAWVKLRRTQCEAR
jgi:hypothetical protein